MSQGPRYHRARDITPSHLCWSRPYARHARTQQNQRCYAGQHAALWVPLGVVFTLLVCAGSPLLTFLVMYSHRTGLETVHVRQTYGFLYDRYV
jgi:hypothetical protein